EVALYHEAGVPVEFVGHPILDVLPPIDRAAARVDLAGPAARLVGVLPGSRLEEIDRHLPLLLAAPGRLAGLPPRTCLVLAPTVPAAAVAAVVHAATRDGLPIRVVSDQTYRVMAAADLLLVASGTATLEAACYGAPMVVLYRLSRVSYAIARRLVRGVSHISLPNILVGRDVVPELIQDAATPEALARAALVLLGDDAARAAQRAGLLEARARLGAPGAGLRAARAVLREARGGGAP